MTAEEPGVLSAQELAALMATRRRLTPAARLALLTQLSDAHPEVKAFLLGIAVQRDAYDTALDTIRVHARETHALRTKDVPIGALVRIALHTIPTAMERLASSKPLERLSWDRLLVVRALGGKATFKVVGEVFANGWRATRNSRIPPNHTVRLGAVTRHAKKDALESEIRVGETLGVAAEGSDPTVLDITNSRLGGQLLAVSGVAVDGNIILPVAQRVK